MIENIYNYLHFTTDNNVTSLIILNIYRLHHMTSNHNILRKISAEVQKINKRKLFGIRGRRTNYRMIVGQNETSSNTTSGSHILRK